MSPEPPVQALAVPPAAWVDPETQTLSRLVATLAEDAIFALAASTDDPLSLLEGLARRRAETYAAVVHGGRTARMVETFDAWVIEMARAMAPLSPPAWMPMGDVIAEKVTLEIGARGLRSLFSSKPSDKDVQRVKRLGTLAVRVLRAVFAADGNIDAEEARTIASLIVSLGLPDIDAAPLRTEEVVPVDRLDVYGEVEPNVARALVRGAWLAAAWDTIDPREEQVVRTLGKKLALSPEDVEAARADALARVDARRLAGLATVDYVRYILCDRFPGPGVPIAAHTGTLMLPRRYREEALAQVGHGAPVTLAGRYINLPGSDRAIVLGIVWAAALHDDPSLGRLALLRARYENVANDLAEYGSRSRQAVSSWIGEALANVVGNLPAFRKSEGTAK
jgi:tellurite resistance protein